MPSGFFPVSRFDCRPFRHARGSLATAWRGYWWLLCSFALCCLQGRGDEWENGFVVFCPEFVHRQYGGRWLPSLRFAVVGGKACHKCLVTWLRPLCLVSERVDHWKCGLYGSIVGWHIDLFVRHMRISALLQTLSSVSSVRFRFFWSLKQQFSRLVSLSDFLVGQLKRKFWASLGSVRTFLWKDQEFGLFLFANFHVRELRIRSCSLVLKKSTATTKSAQLWSGQQLPQCVPF